MNATVNVVCYKSKTLSNGEHPLMIRVYVLNEKNGKYIPEKVGLKAIQRQDVDYEFTLVFDLDIKHNAIASKDRTGLFMGKPEFIINSGTGKSILNWCNSASTLHNEFYPKTHQLNGTNAITASQAACY